MRWRIRKNRDRNLSTVTQLNPNPLPRPGTDGLGRTHLPGIQRPTQARPTLELTFDAFGGPLGSAVDHPLLDLLCELAVPATLFLNERWIKTNPTVTAETRVRSAVSAGKPRNASRTSHGHRPGSLRHRRHGKRCGRGNRIQPTLSERRRRGEQAPDSVPVLRITMMLPWKSRTVTGYSWPDLLPTTMPVPPPPVRRSRTSWPLHRRERSCSRTRMSPLAGQR